MSDLIPLEQDDLGYVHYLTYAGEKLKAKQELGLKPEITRAVAGEGAVEVSQLKALADVVSPCGEMQIGPRKLVDSKVVQTLFRLYNDGTGDTKFIRMVGVYALDPDDGEILYQIVQLTHSYPLLSLVANRGEVTFFEIQLDLVFGDAAAAYIPFSPGWLVSQEDFAATQPTELIATIAHSLPYTPIGALYAAQYAGGIGEAGEHPAGGENEEQIPCKLNPVDSNKVEVLTIPLYAGSPEVCQANDYEFAFIYPDSNTSLFLTMR